jgi:acetate kinase
LKWISRVGESAIQASVYRAIPPRARIYPLPFELARKHRIRRYAFHGVSREYLARRYARIAGKPLESVTVITFHPETGC